MIKTANALKNEAYTPQAFIEPRRKFAKGFDFDPFSSFVANQTIKARDYCTKDCSAYLSTNIWLWEQSLTIWCNPPYSTQEQRKALAKLFQHLEGKEVYLLLNTDNSTQAYKQCLERCTAFMLVSERIKFYRPYSLPYSCPEMFAPYAYPKDQNNNPQTLFFFGTINRAFEFKQELSHLGRIYIND